MSTTDHVLGSALQLPPEDRARLAHGLLVSLDDDPPSHLLDETWAAEIRRRLDDLRSGRVEPLEWAAVRDDIRRELDERAEA